MTATFSNYNLINLNLSLQIYFLLLENVNRTQEVVHKYKALNNTVRTPEHLAVVSLVPLSCNVCGGYNLTQIEYISGAVKLCAAPNRPCLVVNNAFTVFFFFQFMYFSYVIEDGFSHPHWNYERLSECHSLLHGLHK